MNDYIDQYVILYADDVGGPFKVLAILPEWRAENMLNEFEHTGTIYLYSPKTEEMEVFEPKVLLICLAHDAVIRE